MASNPPGACCFQAVKHEGEAKGKIEKVAGHDVYFSHPATPSTNAILFLSDVFGYDHINTQLIADQFAANGYLVAVPDLFRGGKITTYPPPPDFDIKKWMGTSGRDGKGQTPPAVEPVIAAVIAALKESYGVKKLGAAGYCFGGKYVARFSAPGKGVDVAYMAHPSFVEVEELKAMAAPLAIAAAEKDHIFPTDKRRLTEDLLKEMNIPYQITVYSGTEHGFAARGDLSKAPVRFAKEAAFLQGVAWFKEHLG